MLEFNSWKLSFLVNNMYNVFLFVLLGLLMVIIGVWEDMYFFIFLFLGDWNCYVCVFGEEL